MMALVNGHGGGQRDRIVADARRSIGVRRNNSEGSRIARDIPRRLDRLADPLTGMPILFIWRPSSPARAARPALAQTPGGWLQPGGHIDTGETPWEAALRETREELGVRHPDGGPRLLHLDAHPAGPHFHLDLRYLLKAANKDPAPPPGESQQVRWFSLAEALQVADDALIDGVRRLQNYVSSTG